MQLRYYQTAAIEAVRQSLRDGVHSPIACLPTGSGKSAVIAAFLVELASRMPTERFVVCVHTKELVGQLAETYERVAGVAPGVYAASLKRRQTDQQVTFCQIQSVYKRAVEFGRVRLMIVDEADRIPHEGDGQYRTFIRDLRIINPDMRLVGLTATPYRMGIGLVFGEGRPFDELVFDAGVRKLMDDGFLARLVNKDIARPDLSAVHIRQGDYVASELEGVMCDEAKVEKAVAEIVKYGSDREAWLVFCSGLKHAKMVSDEFTKHNVEAPIIDGEMKMADRDALVSRYRARGLKCLVNVNVLTVGFDAPHVDMIALLRPTKSPGLYYQMCLSRDTEILTERGWVSREGMSEGDRIACVREDRSVYFDNHMGIIDGCAADQGGMYCLSRNGIDMRVTMEHDLAAVSRTTGRLYKLKAGASVSNKWPVRIPLACCETTHDGLPLSDDELFFLGWFHSDGYRAKSGQVTISQSKNSPYLSEIKGVVDRLGLKVRVIENKRTGVQSKYAPNIMFCISGGKSTRGSGGISVDYLSKYIVRHDLSWLKKANTRQFDVFFEALFHGDGSKQRTATWSLHTRSISCGHSKSFAEDLQIAAVLNGRKAVVAEYKPSVSWGGSRMQYVVRVSPKTVAHVGGSNGRAEEKWGKVVARTRPIVEMTAESVWCVTSPTGYIIARRNGKPFITGNCGRGLRISEGKRNCLILDMAGLVYEHGPIDTLNDRITTKEKGPPGKAPVKTCEECLTIVAAGCRKCPECGAPFPELPIAKHAATAAIVSPISEVVALPVNKTIYVEHTGKDEGKPPTVCVTYTCGMQRVKEWWSLDLESHAFARSKAMSAVMSIPIPEGVRFTVVDGIPYGHHNGQAVALKTARDWVSFLPCMPTPRTIQVQADPKNPKYLKVVGRTY